jgi:Tol biopolymer transport system component
MVAVATDEETATDSLVVIDLNGEARQIAQITSNPEQEALIVPIRWSPDGAWISYARSHTSDNVNWETDIELLSTACLADPALTCETHTLAIMDDSGERSTVENEGETLLEHWWGMTWSPDGAQLVFLCSAEAMCFLNADGTNFRRSDIMPGGNSLAWSASGDYLAYQAGGDIYVYDIEQDSHTNITETLERLEFVPTWIPLPEGEFLLGIE